MDWLNSMDDLIVAHMIRLDRAVSKKYDVAVAGVVVALMVAALFV